jgi:hypothetical protein
MSCRRNSNVLTFTDSLEEVTVELASIEPRPGRRFLRLTMACTRLFEPMGPQSLKTT